MQSSQSAQPPSRINVGPLVSEPIPTAARPFAPWFEKVAVMAFVVGLGTTLCTWVFLLPTLLAPGGGVGSWYDNFQGAGPVHQMLFYLGVFLVASLTAGLVFYAMWRRR